MQIKGCDLHARQQTLAMLDTKTGEVVKKVSDRSEPSGLDEDIYKDAAGCGHIAKCPRGISGHPSRASLLRHPSEKRDGGDASEEVSSRPDHQKM